MTAAGLRAALWAGPLPDPAAPGRHLAEALAAGLDYPAALERLRALADHGLPAGAALEAALARWDWSIDLGLLAVRLAGPAALPQLAARVAAQGRRRATLARALWASGQTAAALAALEPLDPASETHAEDAEARAELALLAGDEARAAAAVAAALAVLPPGRATRLRLRAVWLTAGAAALARAADEGAGAGAAPEALAFLFEVWLAERDLPRARAVFDRLARLRPAGDAETGLDRVRLALAAEDSETALAGLSALPAVPPADWAPRRHALWLRAALAAADRAADPGPGWAAAADHAERAARLWPGHAGLAGLAVAAQERCLDWDALAAALAPAAAQGDVPAVAARARLGWPDPAALLPPAAPPGPPDARAEARRRASALALEAGDVAAALALTAETAALPAPVRAGLAEMRAEALLWQRATGAALALLDPLIAAHPSRLGPLLQRSRARFFAGDFAGAEADLAEFRRRKRAETGLDPATDLRDRITADALAAAPTGPPAAPAPAALARHPGLAAWWLAQPGRQPGFAPDPAAAIPPQAALYWEGPQPGPVTRGAARWAAVLAGWRVTLFDAPAARAWLAAEDRDALPAFESLGAPAARADLFRACWVARAGGLFVDSDEFPRADPQPWLAGARAVLVLESGYGTAANNFLAAEPGHPLLRAVRDAVLAGLAATPEPYPWWDSGPARLTAVLAAALAAGGPDTAGLRLLSQAEYCAKITTNLPFPHKRGSGHWRQALVRPAPAEAAAAP